MLGLLSRAAELRMRQWDEIVYEIDGPDSGRCDPITKAGVIKASVPDVEIQSPLAIAAFAQAEAQCFAHNVLSESGSLFRKQIKKDCGGVAIEDPPDTPVLNDGLCRVCEMAQIR